MDDIREPVSLDTEQHLIGAALRGGRDTYSKVRDVISPVMFHDTSHQDVWLAIENVYLTGMEFDTVIIGDEIERMQKMGEIQGDIQGSLFTGRALLSELRSHGDPRNIETYAEQVQDYHFKRHLLRFSEKMASWSANGRRAKDIMRDVETEFGKISLYSTQDEYTVPISTAAGEAYDWTDRASRNQVVGVPTGYIDLDKILGAMYGGNVYLVAARPGQGKTALLLNIAVNASQKHHKRICVFSLEMSRAQVAQRMIARESGVDLNKITRGRMDGDEWPKYAAGTETIGQLPIIINDLSGIDINQIRRVARKIKAEGGLDLILVDYIQLAESGEKRNERRELDVSAVSRGLKYLARELDVPVLVAAQMSREIEKRAGGRPILSDLRESGSLEQDAFCVMFIHFEETHSNIAEIVIAKHRNGPTGSCELVFDRPRTWFKDAATRMFNPNGEGYND